MKKITDLLILTKGVIGQKFQKLINTRKAFPSLCKLINQSKVGEKLPNQTYDGALGDLHKLLMITQSLN